MRRGNRLANSGCSNGRQLGRIRHPKENSVNTDDLGAGREATAHLISLGHRRIAHMSYAPLSYLAADARFRGYHQALKEAGIAFNKKLLSRQISRWSGSTIYRLPPSPTQRSRLFARNPRNWGSMRRVRQSVCWKVSELESGVALSRWN